MARVLKTLIPEQSGVITLPASARILSVGFQKDRRVVHAGTASIVVDPTWPVDQINIDPAVPSVMFVATLTDARSEQKVTHVAMCGPRVTSGVAEDFYEARGYTVDSFSQPITSGVSRPAVEITERPNLLPVLWFEEPDVDTVDGDAQGVVMKGGDAAAETDWPQVEVQVQVVPTGEHFPKGYRFVGTLARPQRSDPSKDAVFHIYVQDSSLIRFA